MRLTHYACILLKAEKYNCTNTYLAVSITCLYLRSSKKTNQTRFKQVSLLDLIPDVLLCNFYALTFSTASYSVQLFNHTCLLWCLKFTAIKWNMTAVIKGNLCYKCIMSLILTPVIRVYNKPWYKIITTNIVLLQNPKLHKHRFWWMLAVFSTECNAERINKMWEY